MIGLFGVGQATVRRMGLLEALESRFGDSMQGYEVDRHSQHCPGWSFAQAPGSPLLLMRDGVEQALFAPLPDDARQTSGCVTRTSPPDTTA